MSDDPELPDIAIAPESAIDRPERRRPGRKPILNPDGTRKNPPRTPGKRRDKAPRRTPAPRATPSRASLKTRVAAQLTMLSMIVSVFPPTSRDALSPKEIDLLADGIDKQCQASPRFRKYVELALNASATGGVLGAVVIIGARRVARHELFGTPQFIDPVLGAMIGDTNEPTPVEPPTSDSHTVYPLQYADPEPMVPMGAPAPPSDNGAARVFDFEHGDMVEVVKK